MKKLKKYGVHIGCDFYSENVVAYNLKEAKQILRKFYGYKKLPNGTEFWEQPLKYIHWK